MSEPEENEGLSVTAMVVGVMILITYGCWAIAASAYFGSMFEVAPPEPGMGRFGGRSRGLALLIGTVISFVLNSLRINHAPAIIRNTFSSERWILLTFVILMGATALFGVWVKRLEAQLDGPKRRSRRKGKGRKRRKRPRHLE